MIYQRLGQTDLEVSRLSFGASSLGGVFRAAPESEAVATVHRALDLGVNFIDVAPFYGLTRAEAVLGRALRGVGRGRFFLATKVGRYGESDFDFSACRTAASIDESLVRLGVDHVDLIQVHDLEFGDIDVVVGEALPALARAVEAGKARYIGITGLPLDALAAVLERVGEGVVDTVLSYCHFCLNDTALAGRLDDFERLGVGVINASPTAMGLLTHRGPPGWHPAPAPVRKACAEAARHCAERGVDIVSLAIAFAVSEPRIATTLVGTASPENMADNIRWASSSPDADLLAEVRGILGPVRDQTWPSGNWK